MQRQLSLKMQQENNELHRSTIQLQAEMDANVARMTMSSAAYDQMAKEQQIRSNFAKKRADLEKSSASMGSAFYKSQSDVLDKEEQKQLSIVRNGARDKAQVEGSWTEGYAPGCVNGAPMQPTFMPRFVTPPSMQWMAWPILSGKWRRGGNRHSRRWRCLSLTILGR